MLKVDEYLTAGGFPRLHLRLRDLRDEKMKNIDLFWYEWIIVYTEKNAR